MILRGLIDKILSVQPLDIPEELIGAYLEGHLPPQEQKQMQTAIADNANLGHLSAAMQELPQDFFENPAFPSIEITDDELIIYKLENSDPMNNIIIGEGAQNLSDPVYVRQPDGTSCALRSQQIILRDFGIDIPFKDLEQIALDHGVYSTVEGTSAYDVGKVLEIAGVGVHQVSGTSFMDLANELAQGHRVIVAVDSAELWYTDPLSQLRNWFNDVIGNQGGNHALIVAGIEVNPDNHSDIKVILTDPGDGNLRIEYPAEQFMDAWKDTNFFMVATNDPAPYQYDPATGMEIPSNFYIEQHINEFIAANSYQLAPDMINIPEGYEPAFRGHLPMVGDMDYDTFETQYQEMVDNRLPSTLTPAEQIAAYAHPDEANETDHYEGTVTSAGPGEGFIIVDSTDNFADLDSREILACDEANLLSIFDDDTAVEDINAFSHGDYDSADSADLDCEIDENDESDLTTY